MISNNLDTSQVPANTFMSIAAISEMACIDLDLSIAHYLQKFIAWAKWGYSQLTLDVGQEPVTVLLPISDVCTVTLPAGCVDVVSVGIPWGQYAKTLSVCDDLMKTDRTTENWNPSKSFPPGELPNGTNFSEYGGYVFPNYGGRALFSIGGGLPQRGHYTIKKSQGGTCQELLLDAGLPCTEVYITYIGLVGAACGTTMVHPYMADYIREYLHFQWEKFGKRLDKSEAAIQRVGRDLWDQEMKVRGRINSDLTPKELLRIGRKNYRLTNHV